MAIKFFPKAGQVFVCDFDKFVPPEMNKKRPVVVISPKLPYRSDIATIVPLSTTEPKHALPFTYRLTKNYTPGTPEELPQWAKADMVMNVSLGRLTQFKVGRRKYHTPILVPEDLQGIRDAVLHGLGMGHLLP